MDDYRPFETPANSVRHHSDEVGYMYRSEGGLISESFRRQVRDGQVSSEVRIAAKTNAMSTPLLHSVQTTPKCRMSSPARLSLFLLLLLELSALLLFFALGRANEMAFLHEQTVTYSLEYTVSDVFVLGALRGMAALTLGCACAQTVAFTRTRLHVIAVLVVTCTILLLVKLVVLLQNDPERRLETVPNEHSMQILYVVLQAMTTIFVYFLHLLLCRVEQQRINELLVRRVRRYGSSRVPGGGGGTATSASSIETDDAHRSAPELVGTTPILDEGEGESVFRRIFSRREPVEPMLRRRDSLFLVPEYRQQQEREAARKRSTDSKGDGGVGGSAPRDIGHGGASSAPPDSSVAQSAPSRIAAVSRSRAGTSSDEGSNVVYRSAAIPVDAVPIAEEEHTDIVFNNRRQAGDSGPHARSMPTPQRLQFDDLTFPLSDTHLERLVRDMVDKQIGVPLGDKELHFSSRRSKIYMNVATGTAIIEWIERWLRHNGVVDDDITQHALEIAQTLTLRSLLQPAAAAAPAPLKANSVHSKSDTRGTGEAQHVFVGGEVFYSVGGMPVLVKSIRK